MPDFTFGLPDGRSGTVTAPEGTTQEQAYGYLQQQMAAQQSAGGGASPAAVGPATSAAQERGMKALQDIKPKLPEDKPVPAPTFKSALESIGTSTALGGALGALSPEVLTAAGFAASFIPDVGPEVGSALIEAGTAARGARLAAAGTGALSGALSEGAGQAAGAMGAPESVANTARLGGGMLAPGAGVLASKAKGLYGAVAKTLNLAGESANVAKAAATVRGVEEAGVPSNAFWQTVNHGADAHIQDTQKAGEKMMADVRQRAADIASQDPKAAQKVLDEGKQRADQMVADARREAARLNKASGNRMATAGKVLAQAEPALRIVGQPRELSDIGSELQTAVQKEHQAGLNARASDYNTLKEQRDSIVQQKEAAGETLDKTPAMKDLKSYIDSKTLGSAPARKAAGGLAPVTDQGTLRVYQNVRDAITNRRIQTGVGTDGTPTYQTFKTSFEALDQVRRKLGEVVANRDVEGYSAIGKSVATQLYDRIGKVQQQFVGDVDGQNIQQQLQSNYHDASIGLRKFGTGAGGKATALDRVDPERFAADPQGVPKQFFSSQQSVRDLKELTGDSGLVSRTASSYVSGNLRGLSAKQVADYVEKNSDWMREVPGLQKSVADYANRLGKIEKTAQRAEQSSEQLSKRAGKVVPAAEEVAAKERAGVVGRVADMSEQSVKNQQRILDEGGKAAAEATKAAAAPAQGLKAILMGGERPEAVRELLLNGKPEQTRLAARIASQTPQGQRQLEGSVRQITADMTPATLNKQWNERLKPMLQDGKMISPERLKALDSDIKGLLKAYAGKPPVTLIQRHIYAAIGSASSNYIGGDGREQ